MFIEITNKDLSVIQIGEIISEKKKNGLTPEDAIEILGMTNHYAHINSVIRIISKLPKEEQLNYKDFVIGAVDGRETSKAIYERLQAFADECGYLDEFVLAKNKEKIYDERRVRNTDDKQIRITTREEFEEAQSKSSNIFVDADDIDLSYFSFAYIKKITFKEGAKVNLFGARSLPKDIDVSMCAEVDLYGCDLCEMENLKFREDAAVCLSGAKLKGDIDLTSCSRVSAANNDFINVKTLKFKEGSWVCIRYSKNLPKSLDVSMCSEIWLESCDLSEPENITFRDGSKVILSDAINIPKDLDVSMCSEVGLRGCNLASVTNLKFREGAKVDLEMTKGVPENLDFSMCSEVLLSSAKLDGVKSIKFKNKAQADKFLGDNDTFNGKIIYTEQQCPQITKGIDQEF